MYSYVAYLAKEEETFYQHIKEHLTLKFIRKIQNNQI